VNTRRVVVEIDIKSGGACPLHAFRFEREREVQVYEKVYELEMGVSQIVS